MTEKTVSIADIKKILTQYFERAPEFDSRQYSAYCRKDKKKVVIWLNERQTWMGWDDYEKFAMDVQSALQL